MNRKPGSRYWVDLWYCSSDHVVDRRIEWVSVASKSLPSLPEMIWGMLTCMKTGEYDPINPQGSHFTQTVWKSTLEIGCAFQVCGDIFPAEYGVRKFWVEFQKRNLILIDDYTISQPAKFFVCEYQPRGNVIGEFRWISLFVPFCPCVVIHWFLLSENVQPWWNWGEYCMLLRMRPHACLLNRDNLRCVIWLFILCRAVRFHKFCFMATISFFRYRSPLKWRKHVDDYSCWVVTSILMFSSKLLRTLSEAIYVLLVLLITVAVVLSCSAVLSQAVRTSPSQDWTKNSKALVIGASYLLVVRLVLLTSFFSTACFR